MDNVKLKINIWKLLMNYGENSYHLRQKLIKIMKYVVLYKMELKDKKI